ncbi:MAG: hypothetical protein NVSMB32_16600 [Actinomycetota bacterium]
MLESLLSPGHLILIAIAALLIVGPKRLPEVGRGVGKALREFKKGASEMTDELKMEIHDHPEHEAAKAVPVAPAPVVPPVAPVAAAVAEPSVQMPAPGPTHADAPVQAHTPGL